MWVSWVGAGVLLTFLAGLFSWWWMHPRTPQELFKTRCSNCHELRIENQCEFKPMLRPAIVEVMHHEHGAEEVISDAEALVIQDYLRKEFQCP